jgi:hypothetical protein
MVELNERLPDAGKLLPPAGTPGLGEGRRRTLRERIADRRFARSQPQAGPPDVVDRHRWRSVVMPPQAVDPTTRARLQDSVRALGEEANADRAELERRAMAHDDSGCPPDIFGPNEPDTSGRHHRADRDRGREDRDDAKQQPCSQAPGVHVGACLLAQRDDKRVVLGSLITARPRRGGRRRGAA